MIDYEPYCQIKDYHRQRQLTVPQIARQLHLDERTVARWLAAEKFPAAEGRLTIQQAGFVQKADRSLAGKPSLHRRANLPAAARGWLDTVANVRLHGSTKRQPAELFQTEKPTLRPLPIRPYDGGLLRPVRANRQFRGTVDTNTYSVPAEYAGAALTLKLYPDHLCLYHQENLIARHVRGYDRRRDFEHPDHPKALLQQRRRARLDLELPEPDLRLYETPENFPPATGESHD